MISFRPNPKAVSSYSDQAFKARLREQVNLLFSKLFYYRPIDGEERQLDKKKLLFIGISFLSIAFVTSYIPHIGGWFTKTVQPIFQSASQQLPELAPPLLQTQPSPSVENPVPLEDAFSETEPTPDPDTELAVTGDDEDNRETTEQEALNILDYLFQPEAIKVEVQDAPAVPAPIEFEDVNIDPFPIEAMPPEIRAQLGHSPPLEDLVGNRPARPSSQSGASLGSQASLGSLDSEGVYQGATGVFSAGQNTAQLKVYSDTRTSASTMQLDKGAEHSVSFHTSLNHQSRSLEIEQSQNRPTVFRDNSEAKAASTIVIPNPIGSNSQVYTADSDAQPTTVFQDSAALGATSLFSTPSLGASQTILFQESELSGGSTQTSQDSGATLPSIQFGTSHATRPSLQLSNESNAAHYQSQAVGPSNTTLHIENTETGYSTVFQSPIGISETTVSYQDELTSALSLQTTNQSTANSTTYSTARVSSPTSTVFSQTDLSGGSTYQRIIPQKNEVVAEVRADESTPNANVEVNTPKQESQIQDEASKTLKDYLAPGDQLEATLITGAILLPSSTQVVVAKAAEDWCKQSKCPELLFIGKAEYRSGNRTELQFDKAVLDGLSQESEAVALDDEDRLGLPVTLSDTTPALAQDLVRGALSGVAAYANALASQVSITNLDNTVLGNTVLGNTVLGNTVIEQATTPSIENFVMGNLAQLFATQAEQTAVIRIAELKAGTSLKLLYGIQERNRLTYEPYTTPFRLGN